MFSLPWMDCPSHDDVGGLSSDFGAVRTESRPVDVHTGGDRDEDIIEGRGDDGLDVEEDFQDDEADEEKHDLDGLFFRDDALSDDEVADDEDDTLTPEQRKAMKEQARKDREQAALLRGQAPTKRAWREAVWKSTSASGAPDNSSLSHFSARTRPCWLRRAVRNRHRDAIEQAPRRWRGCRRGDSARTRRKFLISTQARSRARGGEK